MVLIEEEEVRESESEVKVRSRGVAINPKWVWKQASSWRKGVSVTAGFQFPRI
jgi:hypothetical protein